MEQNNQKRNKNNILYGIIGIATLMITTIGATFAYYTATATNNTTLKGNMATITFDLTVTQVTNADDSKGGMIPMSNNMMEQALQSTNGTCIDNNGNAVCQVYKITVVNTSTASMFMDGFVTLTGGSGNPKDYTAVTSNTTTMRWAQAFCTSETSGLVGTKACTTAGASTVRSSNEITWTALGGTSTQGSGLNTAEIKSARTDVTYAADNTNAATINGNKYEVIKQNYIRVSDHVNPTPTYGNNGATYTKKESATVKDITSALVYNQYLEASDNVANNNGTSSDSNLTTTGNQAYTDAQVYYIVVWLSETGTNQTAGSTGAGASNKAEGFFQGNVTFVTAQGSEVTATFADHYRVSPDTLDY